MKTCKICGKSIPKTTNQSVLYYSTRLYCSIACSSIGHTKPPKPLTAEEITKIENRNARKEYCSRDFQHPIYNAWKNIRRRCYNKNTSYYKNYGGRGIEVCKDWRDGFVPFLKWALENGWEEGLSIERIDNDGDYEPNNCNWITQREQLRNTRRNRLVTYNGETKIAMDWAADLKISYSAFLKRLNKWKNVDRVFNEPYHSEYARNADKTHF